jgi:hypothetical protein
MDLMVDSAPTATGVIFGSSTGAAGTTTPGAIT